MAPVLRKALAPRLVELEILHQKILALFREHPELEEDPEFKIDMLEAETDLLELLERLSDLIIGEKGLQTAIRERRTDLASRAERSQRREAAMRTLSLQLLELANLRSIRLSEATVTAQPAPPAVSLYDPSQLPEELWRVTREPNISAILEKLKAGQDVPGASFANRRDIFVVRPK